MKKEFTGLIVEESLEDNRLINKFEVVKVKISDEENPAERWHLYTVKCSEKEIEELKNNLKGKWYAHFWKGREIIAVFRRKTFRFNFDKKETWRDVVNYGLSLGIPREQLDFPIK